MNRKSLIGKNLALEFLYPKNAGGAKLGTLSAKYESTKGAGAVSSGKGDYGGVSYGTYQFSTTQGSAAAFAKWYGGKLANLKPGTKAFSDAWKAEANGKNGAKFAEKQHEYAKKLFYEPAVKNFKSVTGIDASKMPNAVNQVLWSLGVQFGAGLSKTVLSRAGIKKNDSASTIIKKIYAERSKVNIYFKSSSKAVQKGVKDRYVRELKDALNML